MQKLDNWLARSVLVDTRTRNKIESFRDVLQNDIDTLHTNHRFKFSPERVPFLNHEGEGFIRNTDINLRADNSQAEFIADDGRSIDLLGTSAKREDLIYNAFENLLEGGSLENTLEYLVDNGEEPEVAGEIVLGLLDYVQQEFLTPVNSSKIDQDLVV